MTFDRLVFWSGIWNIGLGLTLVAPPAAQLLGVQIPNPFWPLLVAGFLWVLVSDSDYKFWRRATICIHHLLGGAIALFRGDRLARIWFHICWSVADGAVRDH